MYDAGILGISTSNYNKRFFKRPYSKQEGGNFELKNMNMQNKNKMLEAMHIVTFQKIKGERMILQTSRERE